jgi:hypothetical protein
MDANRRSSGESPMTLIELRQKLHYQLDQLAPEELPLVDDFLCSLAVVLPSGQPIPEHLDPMVFDRSEVIDIPEPTAFKDFLANLKQQPLRRANPMRPQVKGKDLLPVVGTWQGDDLETSLQILHETRSQSKF